MLTLAIGGLAAIALLGVAVLIHSARKAVTGFEDDFGFHQITEEKHEEMRASCAVTAVACDQDELLFDEGSPEHANPLIPGPLGSASH